MNKQGRSCDTAPKVLAANKQSVVVVFSSANLVVNGTVYVFYGGGDHVIGLATGSLEELLAFTVNG